MSEQQSRDLRDRGRSQSRLSCDDGARTASARVWRPTRSRKRWPTSRAAIGLTTQIFALPTQITIAVGPTLESKVVLMRLEPGRVNLRKLSHAQRDLRRSARRQIDYREASVLVSDVDRAGRGRQRALGNSRARAARHRRRDFAGRWRARAHRRRDDRLFHRRSSPRSRSACRSSRASSKSLPRSRPLDRRGVYDDRSDRRISTSRSSPGVVVLLPGYSLTLALHELANGDLVAGVARLGRVLSVLLALGCGAFLGFAVIGPSLLSTSDVTPHPVPSASLDSRSDSHGGRHLDRSRLARARFRVGLCRVLCRAADAASDRPTDVHEISAFSRRSSAAWSPTSARACCACRKRSCSCRRCSSWFREA